MNIGQLLDSIDGFEQRFESYFTLVRDKSRNNGARLVSYCLALHRRQQATVLGGLKPKVVQQARKKELKSGIVPELDTLIRVPDSKPEMVTGKELIETAIRSNKEMVCVYRAILTQRAGKEVQAVLTAHVLVKDRDIATLKKMLAMNYF
ncbi:MAG: hypothetical protein WCP86_10695 [bacterium]